MMVVALWATGCGSRTDDAPLLLAGKTVEDWRQNLADEDPERRAREVDALTSALIDDDEPERFGILVPELIDLLDDAAWEVRYEAAFALGLGLERAALPAVEALAQRATSDPEAIVRGAAVDALSEIAPPPRARAEARFGAENLRPAPPDPDPARTRAASAVGLAAVEASLDDPDFDVRTEAVRAVRDWGRHAAHLSSRIAPFLRHDDSGMRYVAVGTCRAIGAPAEEILESLVAIAQEPLGPRQRKDVRPALRRAAIYLIGDLGEPARAALPVLQRLRRDPEAGEAARTAIGKLDPAER